MIVEMAPEQLLVVVLCGTLKNVQFKQISPKTNLLTAVKAEAKVGQEVAGAQIHHLKSTNIGMAKGQDKKIITLKAMITTRDMISKMKITTPIAITKQETD